MVLMKGMIALTLLCSAVNLIFTPLAHPVFAAEAVRISAVYANRSTDNVNISWKSDPETKGQIEYAGPDGNWLHTPWSQDYFKDHSVTLFNLKPDTTYLFKISAENRTGIVQTSSDKFTTLSADVLGTNTTPNQTAQPNNGFQQLLSPSVSPTLAAANPYYPGVLGQQVPYVQVYTAPYPATVQPAITVVAPSPTPLPPTPTATPEPQKGTVSGLIADNFTNLMLGMVLGVTAALSLHYYTKQKAPIAVRKHAFTHQSTGPIKKKKSPRKTFRFTFNAHPSIPRRDD